MKENLLRKPDILHSELWKSLILENISWNILRDLKCYNSVSIEKKIDLVSRQFTNCQKEYETITFCLQIPCEKKTMCEIKAELELPLRQMTSHETQYCVHTQQMNMAVALDTVDQIKR